MSSLLDRFRRSRKPAAVVCYLRENGPIAYELGLFGDDPREPIEAMFETGLSWYWTTLGERERAEAVDWTELTRWSMAAMQRDVSRSPAADVVVIGIDPQDARGDFGAELRSWGRHFATDAPSHLHILIFRSGPMELVFVAQQTTETIRSLLQAWAIDRARAERRAYVRLKDQSLETILDRLR